MTLTRRTSPFQSAKSETDFVWLLDYNSRLTWKQIFGWASYKYAAFFFFIKLENYRLCESLPLYDITALAEFAESINFDIIKHELCKINMDSPYGRWWSLKIEHYYFVAPVYTCKNRSMLMFQVK